MNYFLIILLSLIGTIFFGIIDGLFFLFIEESLTNKLKNIEFLDNITIPLIIGGLSASLSIFVSSFISKILHKHFEILDKPIIDSIGILIGTIIVIFGYNIFKYIRKNIKKSKEDK